MNILLIGGGGREHAIGEAIVRSGGTLFTIMGNLNPGLKRLSKEFSIIRETDVKKILDWEPVRSGKIDYCIVGPEAPLEAGIVNEMEKVGIGCASPTREAAQIETSKYFMRRIMEKYSIPGYVRSYFFDNENDLLNFMKNVDFQFAVKPVGLTGGKGVRVQGDHFQRKEDGISYAIEVIREGIGEGKGVLIEEKMVGEEFTLQAFTDGKNLISMPLVQDFKRAFEGDNGPNTGGMGSYSYYNHLLPFVGREDYEKSIEILRKIVESMGKEGITYRGTIYGQFMLTKNGPVVIEINARFGDPEAINVLPILEYNMVEIIKSISEGTLSENNVKFQEYSTVVKYIVPVGYGVNPKAGSELSVDEEGIIKNNARIYYGSVNEKDGKLYTTHSRSIAIFGKDRDLYEAEKIVENSIKYIKGEFYVRHDIAKKETIDKKVERMRMIKGST